MQKCLSSEVTKRMFNKLSIIVMILLSLLLGIFHNVLGNFWVCECLLYHLSHFASFLAYMTITSPLSLTVRIGQLPAPFPGRML